MSLLPSALAESKPLGSKVTTEELAPECQGNAKNSTVGWVRAVSLSEKAIRLGRADQAGLIQTGSADSYKLASNCLVIRRDGQLGSIADVTPGSQVQVWFAILPSKTKLACSVKILPPPATQTKKPRAPRPPNGPCYAGRVASISPLNNRLTVRHHDADNRKEYSADEPQTMLFTVPPHCPISDKDGYLISLREIPINATVAVTYRLVRDVRNIETVATHIQVR